MTVTAATRVQFLGDPIFLGFPEPRIRHSEKRGLREVCCSSLCGGRSQRVDEVGSSWGRERDVTS